MPRTAKTILPKAGGQCGALMERKRYGRTLEDAGVFGRRRFCNLTCSSLANRKSDPGRAAYGKRARAHLKPFCEGCGTPDGLSIHHKNRNWRDNALTNLATLCASCHTSLHHSAGDISPRRPKPPCRVCGTPSERADLCGKHRQRRQKYGDPCLTKIKRGSSMVLVRQD